MIRSLWVTLAPASSLHWSCYNVTSLQSPASVKITLFVVNSLVSARCLVCDCFRKPPLTPLTRHQLPPGPPALQQPPPGPAPHITEWVSAHQPARVLLASSSLVCMFTVACWVRSVEYNKMFDSDYNCRVHQVWKRDFDWKDEYKTGFSQS